MQTNKIYLMDCFEFLEKVPDTSIDLAIIDPPYNLNVDVWDKFNNEQEFFEFTYKWIDALLPKLKHTASLYIFNTPHNAAYIMSYLISKRMFFRNWITWHKKDGLSYSKKKYLTAQETILFFTKSQQYTFNYDDIRIPYLSAERIKHAQKKGILKNGKRWFPHPDGKLCTDVWEFTSERHQQKINGKTPKLPHPTPKPVQMIERMIKASSRENDLVLDCFCGLGTTAIAAWINKRRFICADNNPEYVRIANQTLKKYLYEQKCRILTV